MNKKYRVMAAKWRLRFIRGFIIGLIGAFLCLVVNLVTGDRLFYAAIFGDVGVAFASLALAILMNIFAGDADHG